MPAIGEQAPSFDDPLGMLRACHRRIQERLDLLERLPEYMSVHGVDNAVRAAAQRVLDYFDKAAQHHHDDEENDLFPMLRAAKGRRDWEPGLPAMLEHLAAEHEFLGRGWSGLRPELDTLARGESIGKLDVEPLVRSYRQHIALENDHLLPLAECLLKPSELRQLGIAMQVRRGIRPPES